MRTVPEASYHLKFPAPQFESCVIWGANSYFYTLISSSYLNLDDIIPALLDHEVEKERIGQSPCCKVGKLYLYPSWIFSWNPNKKTREQRFINNHGTYHRGETSVSGVKSNQKWRVRIPV